MIATAQCLPYGQRLTYWPMRSLLLRLLDLPDDSAPQQIRTRDAIGGSRTLATRAWMRTAELLAATRRCGRDRRERPDRPSRAPGAPPSSSQHSVARSSSSSRTCTGRATACSTSSRPSSQPTGDAPLLMIALSRPELLDRRPSWGGGPPESGDDRPRAAGRRGARDRWSAISWRRPRPDGRGSGRRARGWQPVLRRGAGPVDRRSGRDRCAIRSRSMRPWRPSPTRCRRRCSHGSTCFPPLSGARCSLARSSDAHSVRPA